MSPRPLGPLDATWLHLDRPDNPMIVTAVLALGGAVSYEPLRDALAVRMIGRYPAFRQRLERAESRVPVWVDDPAFDLERHLVRATPIPGATLEELTASLATAPLDRSAPPWQLVLVDRPGEGSAIVARFHHALADGMALARVLLAVTDEGDPIPPGPPPTRPPPSPDPRRLAAALADLERLLVLPADPETPLRGPLGPVKAAGWTDPIALAALKDRGKRLGATVNDLLLTALAGALRAELGGGVPAVRAFVPVDRRGGEPVPSDLGNRFTFVIASLPVGEADPVRRLRAVQAETARIRSSIEPALIEELLGLVGHAPALVQRLLGEFAGRRASLVVTNVPGPREKRHLIGVPIEHLLVWVPAVAGVGVGVSLASYAGEVRIGVQADRGLLAEPGALARAVAGELDRL